MMCKGPFYPAIERTAFCSTSASMRAWFSRSDFTSPMISFFSFLYLRS